MEPWVANALGLMLGAAVVGIAALALLWRVGSWHLHPAAILTFDEGLALGAKAPELAGATSIADAHIRWGGRLTFLVFGIRGCKPCDQLLQIAPRHPATRHMRLVYLTDDRSDPVLDETRWEIYEYHDQESQRRSWRAPVSPYFHVIGTNGRVAAKGVANSESHLDRLLKLLPAGVSPSIVLEKASNGREGGAVSART